jgi:predicted amidohydrolase
VEWAREAVGRGAQLIVLPELASSGYVFESDAEAAVGSRPVDSSDFIAGLAEIAVQSEATIVTGFAEDAGDCRYNTAVVIDATGVRATYRKLHRFLDEQDWFAAGAETVVVETSWGRLGVLICYDLWFPEVARSLALAGADVIAVPTNWVASHKRTVYDERGYCQGNYVAMATAAQNGVAVVCADRVGEERGVRFLGASMVVGPDGWPVAGPGSQTDDELLIAQIDLDGVGRARQRTPRNHLFGDRRPDSYNARVIPQPQQLSAPRVTS